MSYSVYKWLDRLGDLLLPPCCVLCRGPGAAPGRDLCAGCDADLPRLGPCCLHCGAPVPTARAHPLPEAVCGHCRDERAPPYARCYAPFAYAFPFDRLVPALKYRGALTHARVLGLLLADAVAAEGLHHEVDVLVPMPLHVGRLVERGYDQVREIARFVAAPLALPLEPRALERIRATAPQVGLEREARRRNVQGAFAAHARVVAGRRVALLDDVVTTGSTVAAAAEALREAGAVHVQVWCVARALA